MRRRRPPPRANDGSPRRWEGTNVKHTLRNYTFHAVVLRVALGLALSSTLAMAQKRDDILSIQRDVAQLQDQVKQLQAGQDQKIATLESLIKQALEESGKVSSAAAALQRTLSDRLDEQQARVEAPIAALGTKVDQSGDDLRAARENLADLTRRMANLDNKLADISSAVRTLSTPAVAPPPPGATDSPASVRRSRRPGGRYGGESVEEGRARLHRSERQTGAE